jgi:hypothetical protein
MEKQVFMIQPGRSKWLWIIFILVFVTLIGVGGFLGYIFYSAGRATFELKPEGLCISGCLYGRTIAWDKLEVNQAKIVDLSQEPDLQLTARTNGTAIGEYNEGWFRMRNGGKALVFLTKSKGIIYLPTSENYTLLLSPQQTEEMLQALQAGETGKTYPMEPLSKNQLGGIVGIVMSILILSEVLILILFVHFANSTRKTRFEISNQGLRIRGNLYGRKISLDALKIDEAKIVDMKEQREYGTRWRTNGIGMPGYQAGWFRLRKKEKALLFVTNSHEVVYLPTRKGYSILLSPEKPEEFLRVLTSL